LLSGTSNFSRIVRVIGSGMKPLRPRSGSSKSTRNNDRHEATLMSALGQKQTYAVQNGMSALPPRADICSATAYVRFGPKADIEPSYSITLSARASSDGGMVRPIALAALRLMMSVSFVGC